MGACNFAGQDDAVAWVEPILRQTGGLKKRVIPLGNGAAGIIPAGNVLELDLQDGALESVEARVPADLVVVIAAAHSVLAQHAGALGQRIAVGSDHPGVAGSPHILWRGK